MTMGDIGRPQLNRMPNGFAFSWDESPGDERNILVGITNLSHDSRSQAITGEFEIGISKNGSGPKVLTAHNRINLLNPKARSHFVQEIEERCFTEELRFYPWQRIIEQVCTLAVRAFREGEPVQRVGNKPDTMELSYRLYPILEDGEATTIFAPGSSGKSYLADYISVLVHYGVPGLYGWTPQPGNVLYLDWETSKPIHDRRIYAIKQGLGIDDNDQPIFYRFGTQPLAQDIESISEIVYKYEIDLVIVDSQVAASGADPDKADTATQYFNALRQLRRTTLTLDHVPKNSESGKPMPFGSVMKWNRARSIFELKNYQEPGENILKLGLFHRKHNEGQLHKPCGIEITFEYGDSATLNAVIFSECSLDDIPELAKGLPVKDRIKTLLKHGSMPVKDIAEELEQSEATIRTILNREKKLFTKVGDEWGLLTIT